MQGHPLPDRSTHALGGAAWPDRQPIANEGMHMDGPVRPRPGLGWASPRVQAHQARGARFGPDGEELMEPFPNPGGGRLMPSFAKAPVRVVQAAGDIPIMGASASKASSDKMVGDRLVAELAEAAISDANHVTIAKEEVACVQLDGPADPGAKTTNTSGPEWAGSDRSPAQQPGHPGSDPADGKAHEAPEPSADSPGAERRKVEDVAAQAAQALRAIAAEAEARVQAEREATTAEVLAQKMSHEQAMARIQAELAELKEQAAARESLEASLAGTAMARIEAELKELRAAQEQAVARSAETVRFGPPPVQASEAEPLASPSQTENPEQPKQQDAFSAHQCAEAVVNMPATDAFPGSLDKTVVFSAELQHQTISAPRRDASLDKTIVVEDLPQDSERTTVQERSSEVGTDVMEAVEKARAAVAELQRHTGISSPHFRPQAASELAGTGTLQRAVQSAPFSHEAVGLNILLSQDGYTATRSCGCRESVAICRGPLQPQAEGRYFEVEVCQTVDGWMGGLGIGVTHTNPSDLRDQRLPDKAWRVPRSFMLGYSGNKYLNGKESNIDWQPEKLRVGQRVGLLISSSHDLSVMVDGCRVVHVPEAEMVLAGFRDEPLYGIVDVYNAALSVRLR